MGELQLNTNLASEYYVLSMLHRVGANALLTLGNKKAVDIVVERNGELMTIDVKGLMGKTSFPIDKVKPARERHFLVFVSFLNKMTDPLTVPQVYMVPSDQLDEELVYTSPNGKRRVVHLSRLRKKKNHYLHKWSTFVHETDSL